MNERILKRLIPVLSILGSFILFGCAQNNSSGNMSDTMMTEEKPVMEMQEPEKKDSMGMMDEMKNEKSMEKTTDQEMEGMDKMVK